jgi:hypothetical protein
MVVRALSILALAFTTAAIGQDGSRPSDGALKGGAILPGESAGVPQKAPSKCDELQGTLRDDCLKQERDAASGATKAPSERGTRSPERAD